jgi:hypothetical protein
MKHSCLLLDCVRFLICSIIEYCVGLMSAVTGGNDNLIHCPCNYSHITIPFLIKQVYLTQGTRFRVSPEVQVMAGNSQTWELCSLEWGRGSEPRLQFKTRLFKCWLYCLPAARPWANHLNSPCVFPHLLNWGDESPGLIGLYDN